MGDGKCCGAAGVGATQFYKCNRAMVLHVALTPEAISLAKANNTELVSRRFAGDAPTVSWEVGFEFGHYYLTLVLFSSLVISMYVRYLTTERKVNCPECKL